MSTSRKEYDVIIIGGGPGGSTAGFLLSKLGYNVLIIEKETFPRPKLCGGLLSLKTIDLLYQIYGETIFSLHKKHIFSYISDHHEIYYKFERYITRKPSQLPFFFVDRTVYDNFLFEKAKDAGAKVIEGVRIKEINISTCEIKLSNGEILKSKFLIGADGANSIVRQEFFKKKVISGKRWKRYIATGLEVYINRSDLNKDIFDHPILLFGIIKWGYAWIFPNQQRLVVGLGALNRKNKGNFTKALNVILKALNLNTGSLNKVSGHPVPYGNFIYEPIYNNNVILIGDAGGVVDPMYGEGIYFAQKTAQFASLAINKYFNRTQGIRPFYLYHLYKEIFPALRNFMRLRWLCYNPINEGLKFLPIQLIIRIIEKQFLEIINGVRPFRLWKKVLDRNEVLMRK